MTAPDTKTDDIKDQLHSLQEIIAQRHREYVESVDHDFIASKHALVASHSVNCWKDLFSTTYHHLNLTSLPPLKSVAEKMFRWQQQSIHARTKEESYFLRLDCSPGLQVLPTELFWAHSTTDAMTNCIQYFDWQKNDLCIRTNMEHAGGLGALSIAINRYDIAPIKPGTAGNINPETEQSDSQGIFAICSDGNVLNLPTGIASKSTPAVGYPVYENRYDEQFFEARLKSRLDHIVKHSDAAFKLLFFSSPSAVTGLRLPEKQLARWAWAHQGFSFMDGAHILGMANLDLHNLGVDFFATSGHKWQTAPLHVGLAYVRRGKKDNHSMKKLMLPDGDIIRYPVAPYENPSPIPRFWSPAITITEPEKYLDTHASTALLETQGLDHKALQTFRETTVLWDHLGRDLIEQYIVLLSQYLRWRLSEIRPIEALYTEFRKSEGSNWADVWHPIHDKTNFPTHLKTGMTAWQPCAVKDKHDQHYVDSNAPLTEIMANKQHKQMTRLLNILSNRFGIHVRSTRCPHQLRTQSGLYSANHDPILGPITASTAIRFSTNIHHQIEDIDRLIAALTHPDVMAIYDA